MNTKLRARNVLSWKFAVLLASGIIAFACLCSSPAYADQQKQAAEQLVTNAKSVLENFMRHPDLGWVRSNTSFAEGILIVPAYVKAGFVLGGSGGSGVLLAREKDTGEWSYPAFYTMGSALFGLAAGVERAEMLIAVMTQRGINSFLASSFKFGVEADIAAGPVGLGVKLQTADILAFSRSQGLYAGISFEGALVSARESLNHAYYGRPASPVDILIRRNVANSHADSLREAASQLSQNSQLSPAYPPNSRTNLITPEFPR